MASIRSPTTVDVSSDEEVPKSTADRYKQPQPNRVLRRKRGSTIVVPNTSKDDGDAMAGSAQDRSALAVEVKLIQNQIMELKSIVANQGQFNESVMGMLKQALDPRVDSPVIGSNSPHAIQSNMKAFPKASITTNDAKRTTHAYKMRKTSTRTTSKEDPDYVPTATPLTSSDNGSFHFIRRHIRSKSSGKKGSRGILRKGKRILFDSSTDRNEGLNKDRSYVTTSTDRIMLTSDCPNFLQQRCIDPSPWENEIGPLVPEGMPMTFVPTNDMKILGVDLATAAYIFSPVMDQEELLVPNAHCAITRRTLRSLEPGKQVVDDVLILVASMLRMETTELHWFLPTTFTQIATSRGPIPQATLTAIETAFMGKVNRVCKIYCPIWCENHWFLVVVDVVRRQVVYLDSLKSADTRAKRRREIKKVTTFLEELLDHDRWYDAPEKGRELVSDYEIIEPVVVQQDPYSNDCGMFVAQWMIMYHLWGNYDVEKVTDYSRMRLAVDMLLRYHNDNREKIVNAALEYWRNFVPIPQTQL
ncbi:hypothetical protein HN51_024657 [Arachis hypogaea]|nr:Ubiquitin-like-specific protease 1A [Arachis hypogaea]